MVTPAKQCNGCGIVKPISDFSRHKCTKDGFRTRCKKCEVIANTQYRKSPSGASALSEYRNRPEVKAAIAASLKKWVSSNKGKETKRLIENRHPDRKRARAALNHAVRMGVVQPEPCFICGAKAQAHHPNYDAPLSVTWLCPEHHKAAHRIVAEHRYAAGEVPTLHF